MKDVEGKLCSPHLLRHDSAAAGQHALTDANDAIQGGAQLVRHTAHEPLLLLQQPLQLLDQFLFGSVVFEIV